MILTPYTQTEYFDGISNLLPSGKAWDRDTTSGLYELITAIASVYHNQDVLFCDLIDQVFPATSTDLLETWQQTLNLTAGTDTDTQQRNKVVARISQTGSIAKEFFISYAAVLGYKIDIIEYSGVLSGVWRIGSQIGTCSDYSYQFTVTVIVENINGSTTLDSIIGYSHSTGTLVFGSGKILLGTLPTSDPDAKNQLWNNGGVVCISSGHGSSPTDTSVITDKSYNPNDGYVSFLVYSVVFVGDIPRSDPNVKGQIWNNDGVLCISKSGNISISGSESQDVIRSDRNSLLLNTKTIIINDMSTDDPEIIGQLWDNGGVVCISNSQKSAETGYSQYEYQSLIDQMMPLFPAYVTPYFISKITT